MNDEVHMKEVDQVILQFVISRDWMHMYSFVDIDSEFIKKDSLFNRNSDPLMR